MMRALVTGSEGFLGRHLCPELEKAGYEVDRVDRLTPGEGGVVKMLELGVWLGSSLAYRNWYDVVYHLAANILDVDARFKAGVNAYADIQLDFLMAQYIQNHPPKVYVYTSSCAVDNDDDPYSWVKRTGEKFCHALHKTGIEVVVLRPFSGYGSDQSPDYPFRAILDRVLAGDDPVVVWGAGTQVRDWVHVDDLVRAFVMAPDQFPRDVPVELGTGIGTSFLSLAEQMVFEVYRRGEGLPKPKIINDASKETSSRWRMARMYPVSLAGEHGWKSKITLFQGINRIVKELQEAKHES